MTHVPTECEVALLRLRSSTVLQSNATTASSVAERMRHDSADEDAKRCKLALTQLTQRELSILCTDAYHVAERLRDEIYFAHPDADTINGERALVAGSDAVQAMEDISQAPPRRAGTRHHPEREGPRVGCLAH